MFVALIAIVVVVVGGFLAILFFVFNANKLKTLAERGIRIYRVDINRGLVQRNESEKIRTIQALRSSHAFSNEWETLDYLKFWLTESSGEPLFRQAIHELTNKKPDSYSFNFISTMPAVKKIGKNKFQVNFEFHKTDSGFYILIVKWHIISTEKTKTIQEVRVISREELDQTSRPTTGYVAFNVKKNREATTRLLKIISTMWNQQVVSFFTSGLLIIVFQDENTKAISKTIRRFVATFEKYGSQFGAQQLFEGSAYIYADNGHVSANQTKSLQALEFFISISIDKKRNFISLANKEFNLDDYKLFSEGLRIFKNAIRERDIQIEKIPVRNYKNNRQITEFITPRIKGLNNHLITTILKNFNNRQELIDATATKVSQMTSSDPVLVDVTETWLITNKDLIKNKKAIYVVDFEDRISAERIRSIMESLREKNYVFGIRISQFEEKSFALLKRLKPNFVIIDQQFMSSSNLFDSNTYINLLMIAEISEEEKIKIIYEKPSEFIDNYTAEKIGLNYYY